MKGPVLDSSYDMDNPDNHGRALGNKEARGNLLFTLARALGRLVGFVLKIFTR